MEIQLYAKLWLRMGFACCQAELLDRLTENMTVPQLKEELQERNMLVSGRKSELKQRLTGNEQPES